MATTVDIVFLNSLMWESRVPSPGQRLASGLASRHRLLYVEPAENIIRRRPGASRRRVAERVWVQERWRIPMYFARRVDPVAALLVRLNAALAGPQVVKGARALRMRTPVICNALVPGVSVSVCDRLQPSAVIYFATDHIEGMNEPRELHVLEEQWIQRADCIVCTSESLVERFTRPGRRVEFLPNGADVHLFEAPTQELPAEIRDLPRPRAVFAGTVDYRCDSDAICAVADRMPVVVLGVATDDAALRRMRAHPNVHYIGVVPQRAVPAYLHAADVLLMPYLDNLATRFIYPQKLHEYLATGRPVIASRLSALASFESLLTLAATAEFGQAAIGAAARGDEGAEARVLAARANSWDRRVDRFEELLDELVGSG